MRVAMIILLFMFFVTTGCTINTSSKDVISISAERIKESFETLDIVLSKPEGLSPDIVFITPLNGVKPETYTLNENQIISLYVFASSKEAERGLKDFEDKTVQALAVPHSKYQVANVLLFYIPEGSAIDERVEEIMEGLQDR